MPTHPNANPENYRRLFTSVLDLVKMVGDNGRVEGPGVNIGHIAVNHNGQMILVSGFRGYKETNSTDYRPTSEVWAYNQTLEMWQKKQCSGDIPLERSGASGAVVDGQLYFFGGYSEEGNQNTLHALNLRNFTWKSVKPTGNPPLACDKSVCWQYNDKLWLFGGYGRGGDPAQWRVDIGYVFVLDHSSPWHYPRGWNNQLVCYDPQSNQWQWPMVTGDVPIARAAHAAACLGTRVFVFGGRNGTKRMNDMYVLDMEKMNWTMIQDNDEGHVVKGRSWHSLTAVSDNLLMLYGGLSSESRPLHDCWLFNCDTFTWTEVQLPINRPRLWHSAICSAFGEVLICGGATENLALLCHNHSDSRIYARDTFSIELQPKSLFRQCLSAVTRYESALRQKSSKSPPWCDLPHSLQEVLNLRSRTGAHY